MSSNSALLAASVRDLSVRMDDLFLDRGVLEPGWHTLADVMRGGAVLEIFLAAQALGSPGLDRRGQAAYLIGSVCYRLSRAFAAFHLGCELAPRLAPDTLALRLERYSWEHEGETGESHRLVLRLLDSSELSSGALDERRALFAADIEAVAATLIERLVRETALGAAAQYRLAADSIASGFQFSGRALGCEPLARDEALLVIKADGSRLRNPQTHFAEIAVHDPARPDQVLIAETFRMRGGCCRYYTADGGEYCSTCVLRDPDERDDLLRDVLRRKLEAA